MDPTSTDADPAVINPTDIQLCINPKEVEIHMDTSPVISAKAIILLLLVDLDSKDIRGLLKQHHGGYN